jgi:glucosamine-6-phosphate deaminase
VRRYADFLRRFGNDFDINDSAAGALINEVEAFLKSKQVGEIDAFPVQVMKRAIRESEAVSGIETFGMKREQARFLNLPFYQTGKVKKDPIGPDDVRIVLELLEEHQPELVFVAGDLSDPHGTHRMCLEAIQGALAQYSGQAPEMWYYRGAWQEWELAEADVLVPLSEEELRAKIMAIFKHQSQKDRAPFPGQDDREFWQRVEERNRNTAERVDKLGLPEYFAMEAYVVRRGGAPIEPDVVATSSLAEKETSRARASTPAKVGR